MDYTSFAPGPSNNSKTTPPSIRPKTFTPKFIGGLLIIIALAGGVAYGIWMWGNQNSQVPIPSATPSQSPTQIIYNNNQYGFSITLPESWSGYTIINNQWQGTDVATGKGTAMGPIIVLRNPQWTANNPTEDMPVMVFTPAQWTLIENETLAVSAAPIPPSLLGQNSKYILALPARYNYDYKTDWQEVDQLVHTLKAFEPTTP